MVLFADFSAQRHQIVFDLDLNVVAVDASVPQCRSHLFGSFLILLFLNGRVLLSIRRSVRTHHSGYRCQYGQNK